MSFRKNHILLYEDKSSYTPPFDFPTSRQALVEEHRVRLTVASTTKAQVYRIRRSYWKERRMMLMVVGIRTLFGYEEVRKKVVNAGSVSKTRLLETAV